MRTEVSHTIDSTLITFGDTICSCLPIIHNGWGTREGPLVSLHGRKHRTTGSGRRSQEPCFFSKAYRVERILRKRLNTNIRYLIDGFSQAGKHTTFTTCFRIANKGFHFISTVKRHIIHTGSQFGRPETETTIKDGKLIIGRRIISLRVFATGKSWRITARKRNEVNDTPNNDFIRVQAGTANLQPPQRILRLSVAMGVIKNGSTQSARCWRYVTVEFNVINSIVCGVTQPELIKGALTAIMKTIHPKGYGSGYLFKTRTIERHGVLTYTRNGKSAQRSIKIIASCITVHYSVGDRSSVESTQIKP